MTVVAPVALLGCTLSSDQVDPPLADAAVDSSAPSPDAASTDASPDAQAAGCVPADGDTLAMLRMESVLRGATPDDSNNGHIGTAVPDFAQVPGPPGCGNALSAAGQRYLEIEDEAAFQLAVGSVDLFVRIPDAAGAQHGVASRDAIGQAEDGHFTLFIDPELKFVFRMQTTLEQFHICSEPQTPGAWVRVGMNFGPPAVELFVDGTRADEPTGQIDGMPITCQSVATIGIAGNTNPWVVGTSSHLSMNDLATPTDSPLATAVDEFRVSSTRRDYTAP